MAPGRPVNNVTVHVPRHNAQRIGLKLSAEIKKQGRSRKILVDVSMPHPDLNASIESASEWNSMLATARAERGPQWDVGTQQFLVDEHSDLYYDPTPLLEAVKKKIEEEKAEEQAQQAARQQQQQQQHLNQLQAHHLHQPHAPQHITRHDSGHQEFHLTSVHQMNAIHSTPSMQRHHGPPPGHGPGPPASYPYPGSPVANMGMRPPPPPHNAGPFPGAGPGGVGPGGQPFNPIPPNQFYGGDVGGSPVRMGGMGGMGNMGNMGNMANMGGIGNVGGMGNMGNMGNMGMGGMGGVGNVGHMGGAMGGGMGGMANMANMGNINNMGGMGGMNNIGGIGGMGNMGGVGGMGGPMGMIDHPGSGGMGGHPMGGMGGMGGGGGMPMNLSPDIRRRMGRGGFGEDGFGMS